MAVDANTRVTFDETTMREQLKDELSNVSPTDKPFTSMTGDGDPITNTTSFDWSQDALAAAAVNAHLEGDDDPVLDAPTVIQRPKNRPQISKKTISVSGSDQSVDVAGVNNTLDLEESNKREEIMLDLELMYLSNAASVIRASGVAGVSAGAEAWYETNVSRGAGGSSGGFQVGTGLVDAATDGTQRVFSESLLNTVLDSMWDEGSKEQITAITGSFNQAKIASFTGIASNVNQINGSDSDVIVNTVDIYKGPHQTVKVVASRLARARTCHLFDPMLWKKRFISDRKFMVEELAKTGDATRKSLLVEWGLESTNEKGSGVVADLTTA